MRISILLAAAVLLAGCGASATAGNTTKTDSTAKRQLQWSHAPKLTIDQRAKYSVTVKTNDGSFTMQLLPRVAPITVNNFVFLARHRYFDGIIFHRIIKNFALQTGDPTGTGAGGPGYTFRDEPVTLPYTRGTVAMANSGPNTNGSQFFIVVAPRSASLPPSYTIFGKVSSGWATLNKIANTPVAPSPSNPNEISSPVTPVTMQRVTVVESR